MTTHASPSPEICPTGIALPDRFVLIFPIARPALADDQSPSGNDQVIELCIEIELSTNNAATCLMDPSSHACRILRSQAKLSGIVKPTPGWLHLEIPGMVSCSITLDENCKAALSYATTPLLSELGIRGGRFGAPTIRSGG